jgi:hypothetical protein
MKRWEDGQESWASPWFDPSRVVKGVELDMRGLKRFPLKPSLKPYFPIA